MWRLVLGLLVVIYLFSLVQQPRVVVVTEQESDDETDVPYWGWYHLWRPLWNRGFGYGYFPKEMPLYYYYRHHPVSPGQLRAVRRRGRYYLPQYDPKNQVIGPLTGRVGPLPGKFFDQL